MITKNEERRAAIVLGGPFLVAVLGALAFQMFASWPFNLMGALFVPVLALGFSLLARRQIVSERVDELLPRYREGVRAGLELTRRLGISGSLSLHGALEGRVVDMKSEIAWNAERSEVGSSVDVWGLEKANIEWARFGGIQDKWLRERIGELPKLPRPYHLTHGRLWQTESPTMDALQRVVSAAKTIEDTADGTWLGFATQNGLQVTGRKDGFPVMEGNGMQLYRSADRVAIDAESTFPTDFSAVRGRGSTGNKVLDSAMQVKGDFPALHTPEIVQGLIGIIHRYSGSSVTDGLICLRCDRDAEPARAFRAALKLRLALKQEPEPEPESLPDTESLPETDDLTDPEADTDPEPEWEPEETDPDLAPEPDPELTDPDPNWSDSEPTPPTSDSPPEPEETDPEPELIDYEPEETDPELTDPVLDPTPN